MNQSRAMQRIKRLRSRQSTSAWVKDYKPGTKATRSEAPSISNATIIRNTPKFGRDLHALSSTECACLILALWLENVIDVNEQKVLQPFESPHPLANHPLAAGLHLRDLKGMYWAYKSLGGEEYYPQVSLGPRHNSNIIPNYLEGDILLYLKDDSSPYCVNWTVKATDDQFSKSCPEDSEIFQSEKEKEKSLIRHAAEELYYNHVGIPTHRITADKFSRIFKRNLVTAYTGYLQLNDYLRELLPPLTLLVNNTFGTGDTGVDLGRFICKKYMIDANEWKILLYSLIWLRKININLENPFLIDQPLIEHSKDNAGSYLPLLKRP